MKCPKCGERYVEIYGVYSGTQKIQFHDDDDDEDFTVVDSEPTDFEWDDDTTVVCLECGHEGTAGDFELAAFEADQGEAVRPADAEEEIDPTLRSDHTWEE